MSQEILIANAFMWGLISALSLTAGALIALWKLPSERTRAAMMAFGAGALLFALSIELFGHALFEHELEAEQKHHEGYNYALMETVLVMVSAAICGGFTFFLMDQFLNQKGAFLRNPSLLLSGRGRKWVAKLRVMLRKRAMDALRKEERIFAAAPERLVADLVLPFVERQIFAPGETIFETQDRDSPFFIVLNGCVSITFRDSSEVAFRHGAEDPILVGEDQLFGEMALLTGRTVHSLAVAGGAGVGNRDNAQLSCTAGDRMVSCLKIDRRHIDALMLASADAGLELDRCRAAFSILLGPPPSLHELPLDQAKAALAAASKDGHGFQRAQSTSDAQKTMLAGVPISTAQMMSLLALGTVETYSEGDIIYNEVDCYSPFYLVCQGAVKLTNSVCDDSEATAAVVVDTSQERKSLLEDKSLETVELKDGTGTLTIPSQILAGPKSVLCAQALNPGVNCEVCEVLITPTVVIYLSRQRRDHLMQCSPDLANAFRSAANNLSHAYAPFNPRGHDTVTPLSLSARQNDLSLERDEEVARRRRSRASTTFSETRGSKDSDIVPWPRFIKEGDSISESTEYDQLTSRRISAAKRRAFTTADLEGGYLHDTIRTTVHQEDLEAITDMDIIELEAGEALKKQKATAKVIWLGICIDAVPESLVIGFLVASGGVSDVLVLVFGVFLSNFPEAMSSSAMMASAGLTPAIILGMWTATALSTGVGAAIGAAIVPEEYINGNAKNFELFVQGMEGLAAGAMLAMIAQTMLPHAFHEAGSMTGMTTLAGFLCALMVKLIPV